MEEKEPMTQEKKEAVMEEMNVKPSPFDNMKISINLIDKFKEAETATGKKVDFKNSLLDFIDSYLQNYDCPQEEKDKIALVRSRVMILL